jgi:hypothetical protein
MSKHLDPPHGMPYYIWQTHMYGTGKVDAESPAEVYRFRPMPCTPAGDCVGVVRTGAKAKEFVETFNRDDTTLDEAKDIISKSDDLRFPKCQDCKWPLLSRVAKSCPCNTRDVSDEAIQKHDAALKYARSLQDDGIPLTDPRYY